MALGEPVVPVGVVRDGVPLRGPRERESDRIVIGGRGDGEHPLGPVSDLLAAAQQHLGDDRAHERAGELVVADATGSIESGAEIRPQLAEASDALDLLRACEELPDASGGATAPTAWRPATSSASPSSSRR